MFNFKQTQSLLGRGLLVGGLIFYATNGFAQNEEADALNSPTQPQTQTQAQWAEANRLSVIQHILNGVRAEAESKGYEGWSEELSAFLNELPGDQLLNAYHAEGFDEVVAAIRGQDSIEPQAYTVGPEGLSSSKLLGDTLEDLVFTPLTPCRIVDTRVSGGKYNNSETRMYTVNGNTSGQGGKVNCGVPNGANEPPAVVLNITSSGGEGNGFLTVWEIGAAQPNASLLNYQTSDIANGSIVPTGLGQVNEIQVFASSRTHVIIDVIGFLRKPEKTPVTRMVTAANTVDVFASGNIHIVVSPSCPAGFTAIGGAFSWDDSTGATLVFSLPNAGNTWRCAGRNTEAFTTKVLHCSAVCVQVPGY